MAEQGRGTEGEWGQSGGGDRVGMGTEWGWGHTEGGDTAGMGTQWGWAQRWHRVVVTSLPVPAVAVCHAVPNHTQRSPGALNPTRARKPIPPTGKGRRMSCTPPPAPHLPPPPLPAVSRSPTPHDVTGTRDGSRGQSHTRHCQHSPPPGPHPPPPPAACQGFAPPIAPQMSAVPPDCPRVEPRRRWGEGDPQRPPPPPPPPQRSPSLGWGRPRLPLGPPKEGGGGGTPGTALCPPTPRKGLCTQRRAADSRVKGGVPPPGMVLSPYYRPHPRGVLIRGGGVGGLGV